MRPTLSILAVLIAMASRGHSAEKSALPPCPADGGGSVFPPPLEISAAELCAHTSGTFHASFITRSRPLVVRNVSSAALAAGGVDGCGCTCGTGHWGFLTDTSIAAAFENRVARAVRVPGGAGIGLGSSIELPYATFVAHNAHILAARAASAANATAGTNSATTGAYPVRGSSDLYLAQNDLFDVPAIERRIAVPHFARALEVHRSMLWVSHTERSTPLHYDDVENVMFVVQGRKRFSLFPPSDACRLDPRTLNAGLAEDEDELEIASAFDIFSEDPGARLAPERAGATRYEVTVGPGDMIYLPAFWWHGVSSDPGPGPADPAREGPDRCVAVNWWFDSTSEFALTLYRAWEARLPPMRGTPPRTAKIP